MYERLGKPVHKRLGTVGSFPETEKLDNLTIKKAKERVVTVETTGSSKKDNSSDLRNLLSRKTSRSKEVKVFDTPQKKNCSSGKITIHVGSVFQSKQSSLTKHTSEKRKVENDDVQKDSDYHRSSEKEQNLSLSKKVKLKRPVRESDKGNVSWLCVYFQFIQ